MDSNEKLVITPDMVEEDELVDLTVDAQDAYRGVYGINLEGEKVQIGRLTRRYYDAGHRATAINFEPLEDQKKGSYRLGVTTGEFKTVDHYTVAEPFLQMGFQPRQLRYTRGGAAIFTLLAHPDLQYEDPIGEDTRPMELSVGLWNSLKPGRQTQVTAGFFRYICVNGLVVKAIGLGGLSFNHGDFNADHLNRFAGELAPQLQGWVPPALNSPRGLEVIGQYLLDSANKEDSEEIQSRQVPEVVRNLLVPLQRRPQGYRKALGQELLTLVDTDQAALNVLTLTNSVSSAINQVVEDRMDRPSWFHWGLESMVDSVIKLSDLAEFFTSHTN